MTSTLQLTAERAPFVMLPRWLLYHRQVGEGAKFLYCVLHDLVAGREGPTRPVTRAELADRCGVSANTIDRRLSELVGAGAVDKEPQILAGGQVGNIYRVWLSPPEQRPATRLPTSGAARSARLPNDGDPPRWAVDNRLPTDGEAQPLRIPSHGEPPRQWGASLLSGEDPTVLKEQDQELPPQPPRPAGGQEMDKDRAALTPPQPERRLGAAPQDSAVSAGGAPQPSLPPVDGARRQVGTNPRALGTNPRGEAQVAESARLEAEAAARQAEFERRVEARRAADEAADREAQRLEAEALSLSAALEDETLADVARLVRTGMAGPLARSPLAISRAVVTWCRAAVAAHPGPVADAVHAGLAGGLAAGEGTPSMPLDLPEARPDTAPLRRRIAQLVSAAGVA